MPSCTLTRQVVEVCILSVLMEDSGGSVFDFRRCKHGDSALGKLVGETGPTLRIFDGGDSGSHYSNCGSVH